MSTPSSFQSTVSSPSLIQASSPNQVQPSCTVVQASSSTCQSSSTTTYANQSTNSSYVLQQINLKPFDLDPDDAYHFLLAELSPAVLQDIPEADLGDVNHPAAIRCNSAQGLFAVSDIKALINHSPPTGPLYTSEEVLNLALEVSAHNSSNWKGAQIPIRTHLNVDALSILLEKYPDPWVLRGAIYG